MTEQPLTKQLAPLIIFLALIIVLTLIIWGSRFQTKEKTTEQTQEESSLQMRLSPISLQRRRASRSPVGNPVQIPKLEIIMNAAVQDINARRLPQAEDKLRTALVFYPKNPQLLSMLGNVLYLQQNYKGAEWAYRRMTALNPEDPVAFNNLGTVLASQKRYEEAASTVKQGCGEKINSPETALNLSGIYSLAGNTAEAIEYFRKAYNEMGERILPLSYSSNFDNIRNEKAFQKIIQEAKQKRGEKAK